MAVAIGLHLLAALIWVGGMFFAWMFVRPVAASRLEPPQRLSLWAGIFRGFFPWVWASIILLLASGFWMVFAIFGGMAGSGWHIHAMIAIGVVMMLLFMHVFFAPYKRLRRAVEAEDWPTGGAALAQIRRIVGINTLLGLALFLVASGGRYL